MGLDYSIICSCAVQEKYHPYVLVQILKMQQFEENIPKTASDGEAESGPKQEQFGIQLIDRGPKKSPTYQLLPLGEMGGYEELSQLSRHCSDCPMNVHNRPLGCAGHVYYPITREAERWLLTRLPDSYDDPRSEKIDVIFPDVTLKEVAAERHQQYIFEKKIPLTRKWKIGRYYKIFSSKQLFKILVSLQGVTSFVFLFKIAWLMGFINDQYEPFTKEEKPENYPNEEDEECVYELKGYFLALARAASQHLNMFIDG